MPLQELLIDLFLFILRRGCHGWLRLRYWLGKRWFLFLYDLRRRQTHVLFFAVIIKLWTCRFAWKFH